MLLEDLLWLILSAVVIRAVWRVIDGIVEGMSGQPPRATRASQRTQVPTKGVQMARDPVCGTYVVPSNAVVVSDGSGRVYFCSTACRDKYRARTA